MTLFDAWPSQLGAVGLVGLFVIAILTGRLVARSMMKTVLDQAELRVQLAERETERWRDVAQAEAARADLYGNQLAEMARGLHAVEGLVRALPGGRGNAA